MNCDECQDQVFELIEREASDPEGVRELLDRCPECQAAFVEMKRTLALVGQLPLEQPSSATDAAVLAAAAARLPDVVRLRKRRLQAPPWAMAAIALLAVGVGVWTIPSEVQLEGSPSVAEQEVRDDKDTGAVTFAEEKIEDDEGEFARRSGGAEPPATNAPKPAQPRPEALRKRKADTPARAASKRGASVADERESVRTAELARAPASLGAADSAMGSAEEFQSSEVAAKASAPSKEPQDREQDEASDSPCGRNVAELERRIGADADYAPSPREQLAIGRCYQSLGNVTAARTWFKRAATHRRTKAAAEQALRDLSLE